MGGGVLTDLSQCARWEKCGLTKQPPVAQTVRSKCPDMTLLHLEVNLAMYGEQTCARGDALPLFLVSWLGTHCGAMFLELYEYFGL